MMKVIRLRTTPGWLEARNCPVNRVLAPLFRLLCSNWRLAHPQFAVISLITTFSALLFLIVAESSVILLTETCPKSMEPGSISSNFFSGAERRSNDTPSHPNSRNWALSELQDDSPNPAVLTCFLSAAPSTAMKWSGRYAEWQNRVACLHARVTHQIPTSPRMLYNREIQLLSSNSAGWFLGL